MDEPMNDGVLTATRWIINILMGIMVVACVAIVVILPLSLIYQADFRMEFLEVFPGKNFDYFSVLFSLMLLCALAVLALAFLFLKKLKEIIDTVRSGDPFVRTNARRLKTMAWLMLAIQIATIALAIPSGMLDSIPNVHSEPDVSLDGFFMVLLLFVLARVFERGADMREELEGTV